MKKIAAILIVACMCAALMLSLGSCSVTGESHMGFKVISTDINDFNLEVPSEWTVTSQNGYVSATANGETGDESNISVMSSVLNSELATPEGYFDSLIASYEELYDNVAVEGRDIDTKLGDKNAKKYVFTADILGESYKFMQVLCVYGGRVYIFTYTSQGDYYALHETEVQYILEYFAFKV